MMLSGIQHFVFCKRQWALIEIEEQWADNLRTIEGNILHQRAHEGPTLESRGQLLISREMRVFSAKLGISGICDVVEFHRCTQQEGISLFQKEGFYRVVPVEYKKGEPKISDADRLQLVAQAVCLEEMLCTDIPYGYLYYGATRHREKVEITQEFRQKLENVCAQMHDLFQRRHTPMVKRTKACNACSLKEICLPKLLKRPSVHDYIRRQTGEEEP